MKIYDWGWMANKFIRRIREVFIDSEVLIEFWRIDNFQKGKPENRGKYSPKYFTGFYTKASICRESFLIGKIWWNKHCGIIVIIICDGAVSNKLKKKKNGRDW